MKKNIGKTENGFDVYVIIDNEHMKAHSDATNNLIAEAIRKVTYTPPFWMNSIDMERTIGKDSCVEVTSEDDVRWICRPGREIKSPVVFNKEPKNTSMFTVGLCTDDDGLVTVFTAFAGLKAPKEPNDPHLKDCERAESEEFWRTHALCNC